MKKCLSDQKSTAMCVCGWLMWGLQVGWGGKTCPGCGGSKLVACSLSGVKSETWKSALCYSGKPLVFTKALRHLSPFLSVFRHSLQFSDTDLPWTLQWAPHIWCSLQILQCSESLSAFFHHVSAGGIQSLLIKSSCITYWNVCCILPQSARSLGMWECFWATLRIWQHFQQSCTIGHNYVIMT